MDRNVESRSASWHARTKQQEETDEARDAEEAASNCGQLIEFSPQLANAQ